MSQTVYLTKKAYTYANQDIESIVATVEKISSTKVLAGVSELTDVHRRNSSRNIRKVQQSLFGKRTKPFVFVSCLN